MKTHRYTAVAVVVLLLAAFAAYAEGPAKRSAGEYVDDKAVSAKVKAALLKDPDVKGLQVKVETYNGVVQLSGFVDKPEQASRAVEVAKGIEGVKSVKNDMKVKGK
ncbi:BON domain-containing protein [bacterium]|nr:BON domain-containing protein [bacterium]